LILTTQLKLSNLIPLILAPLLALVVWSSPLEMEPSAQKCAGLIVWVAGWWMCSLIPLHVTGMIGLIMAHFMNLSSWAELLVPYADPIIFLFMGGFFIAQAVEYHSLDKWLVHKTLSLNFIRGNSQRLFISLSVLTALMSAFLSNTATAALVIPIGIEILRRSKAPESAFKLILLLAGSASIGGTMTPVGSPPNMIALGLMQKILGHRPDFLSWVLHMAPLSLMMLLALIVYYKKDIYSLSSRSAMETHEPHELNNSQKILLSIIVMTCFFWFAPGIIAALSQGPFAAFMQKNFTESLVASLAGVILMITPTKGGPLLPWREAQKIDWATLMLFGSGISIGQLAFKTGLASVLAMKLEALSHLSPELLLIIAIIATLFFTELASNTATANLIIPVLLASSAFLMNADRTIYAIVAAANLAFMLPVGTPPNAIAFATGKVSLMEMMKRGFFANCISAFLIIFFSLIFF
jgi:solute carrier family 13 (sodium-dependent dicarboxylate transporter), member 2/3/5